MNNFQINLRLNWKISILLIIVFAWCIALPFSWANYSRALMQTDYWSSLALYKPELTVGLITLLSMLALFISLRFSIIGFVVAAFIAPVLKFIIGSPTYGVWPISSFLLLLLGWRLHAHLAKMD